MDRVVKCVIGRRGVEDTYYMRMVHRAIVVFVCSVGFGCSFSLMTVSLTKLEFPFTFFLYILLLVLGGLGLAAYSVSINALRREPFQYGSILAWQPISNHRWRRYISRAKIRWVRAGAFRRWHRNRQTIPRAQRLQPQDFAMGGHSLGRVVISHPWLSQNHPDPKAEQLADLVAELDRYGVGDDELVFYDYCSLPQINKLHPDFQARSFRGHPANRTHEENKCFKLALKHMHLLYTAGFGRVLVLPRVPEGSESDRPYIERGWCYFELAVAASSGRIYNMDNASVSRLLNMGGMPVNVSKFRSDFARKHFTCNGDVDIVNQIYAQMSFESTITLVGSALLCVIC